MKKDASQRLRILYIMKILSQKTDDRHSLTLEEITGYLKEYCILVERKTLYKDFAELKEFGFDINYVKEGRTYHYTLSSRDFELPELKLLVDSVQAAKFITEKKSKELIKKLESLTSEYEAGKLQRQVTIAGRVKTVNEKIYYNVDTIHDAINADRQISFFYFQWTPEKKQELKKGGKRYVVSPWYLVWDDEYYYMVGYDAEEEKIKHYRLDKMQRIDITDIPRDGKKIFRGFSIAAYSKQVFGMMGGDAEQLTLECKNEMAGVIIDRFGHSVDMRVTDPEHFTATVNVIPEGQFLGWVIGLGGKVRITGPESVVEEMRRIGSQITEDYSDL